MDAKEYFESKRGCQKYIFGKSEMIEFADIYHAERSKEEAEERYDAAQGEILRMGLTRQMDIDKALRIASGKKEG